MWGLGGELRPVDGLMVGWLFIHSFIHSSVVCVPLSTRTQTAQGRTVGGVQPSAAEEGKAASPSLTKAHTDRALMTAPLLVRSFPF